MINKDELKLVFDLAIQGLKTNKLRTILTTVGIIIGIATIVIVMSAGRGLEKFIIDEVSTFGADTIEIEIKIPSVSDVEMMSTFVGGAEVTTLKLEDFEAVKKLPNVDNYYASILGQFKSVYENKTVDSMIFAVTSSLPEIDRDTKIAKGRFFTDREDKSQARVIVLGPEAKNKLFGDDDPIGKSVKINKVNFKVIGVTEERGTYVYFNFDDMIYMPLITAQKQLLGIDHVMFGFLTVKDQTRTAETVADIHRMLRQRHGLPPNEPEKDDFRAVSMQEAIDMVSGIVFATTILVLAIAAISLIVGGVGIMNVMYLSVLERTREIGLRKAIGASNSIIKAQFLVEALLITIGGGIIGIVLGTIIVTIIGIGASLQGYDFELFITLDAILLGFGSAVLFGILFGLYPSRKASELSPVDALRYE